MLTRLREARTGDTGITLVEVVVAMVLMTIVGAMSVQFFVTMFGYSGRSTDQNLSSAMARNVLDEWTALLRVADSPSQPGTTTGRIAMITATELQFYANVGNRNCAGTCTAASMPTLIDLSLSGSELYEKRYVYANGAYPSTPTVTDVLASGVSAPVVGQLFTPYVMVGGTQIAQLPNDCPGGALGACTGTTGADAFLSTVVRIDITFQIRRNSTEPQATFTSSAAIGADT
jgi:type II secretory pathway component PulJ